jgi:hypothetical protein
MIHQFRNITLAIGVLLTTPLYSDSSSMMELSQDRFTKAVPTLAYEVAASVPGMGKYSFSRPGESLVPQWTGSIQIDFQPTILQKFGVFGFGPSFNLSPPPVFPGEKKYNLVYGFSVGAQVRYQLKFWDTQPVVPMVAYSGEYYRYKIRTGGANGFIARGPILGVWIHLNALDDAAARTAFFESGIVRSYLVVELRRLTGGDGMVSLNSSAYYSGIRLEY